MKQCRGRGWRPPLQHPLPREGLPADPVVRVVALAAARPRTALQKQAAEQAAAHGAVSVASHREREEHLPRLRHWPGPGDRT